MAIKYIMKNGMVRKVRWFDREDDKSEEMVALHQFYSYTSDDIRLSLSW